MGLPILKESVYILDFDGVFVSNLFEKINFNEVSEDDLRSFYFDNLNSICVNNYMIDYVKSLKKENNVVYILTGRKDYMIDYVKDHLNSNNVFVDKIVFYPSNVDFDKDSYIDWKLSEIERIINNHKGKRIVFVDDIKELVDVVADRFDIEVYRYLFLNKDKSILEKIKG